MTQIIDLSYAIHQGMFKYSSDAEPEVKIIPAEIIQIPLAIPDESGFGSGAGTLIKEYKSGRTEFRITSHHGTHVDAPSHKIAGGKTIDKYPEKKLENICALIDLTETDLMQRSKREIQRKDIENKLNDYKSYTALVFYTGFCDEMRKKEGKLTGEDKTGFEKTFPYFSQEAAKYIVDNMPHLNIVGIDSFSVDPSGSNSEVHRIFFEKDILPLETLYNLKELKQKWNKIAFRFYTHLSKLLNYNGADAAQVRAYAEV